MTTIIAQICNPNAEFAMPLGVPTKKAKVGTENYPVTAEAKIRKSSV